MLDLSKENLLIENYWINKLSGDLPKTTIPSVGVQSKGGKVRKDKEKFYIKKDTQQSLMKMVKNSQVGMFVLLLSGVSLSLNKYTGKEDLFIGTLPHKDSSNPNNILFFRNQIHNEDLFKGFINRVKENIFSDMKNMYDFFGSLLQRMVQNNIDINKYFNIAVVYDEIHKKSAVINNYDIVFNFFEEDEQLVLEVVYNASNFSKEIINLFCNNLLYIYDSFENLLDQKIKDIQIVSEEEKESIEEFNKTDKVHNYNTTLHQLFEEQVRKNPENTAIVLKEDKITYKELNDKVNQLASMLREKGIVADNIVGIKLEKSIDMIVAILAVLKSGGAYLPIDLNLPVRRVQKMLQDCNAKVVISTNKLVEYEYTRLQGIRENDMHTIVTEPREYIADFNTLPFPNYSLINCEKYNKYIGQAIVKSRILIQASRGCPYDCAYCYRTWNKCQAARSGENLFEEIKLYYDCGIRNFDIFMLNHREGKRFFELIIKNNLKDIRLFFPNGLRGDALTKDYIDLMVAAGTVNMSLALEAASPRLQKLIRKNLNIGRFTENVEYITSKYPNVILEMFTMHGIPTETEEEALMTLEYIKKRRWIHFPYVNVLKIYQGTQMEKIALEHGISKQSIIDSEQFAWDELTDTLPFNRSFSLRYQSDFLDSYVLSKERLKQVVPYQMKIMTESEFIEKYDSYLPGKIKTFDDFLNFTNLKKEDLRDIKFKDEEEDILALQGLNEKLKKKFYNPKPNKDALNMLFLDLSQYFDDGSRDMLYDVVESPLGLMYILTYLQEKMQGRINGKLAKPRMDFANFYELKKIVEEFKPDVIGVRSLSYYKDFCHKTIALLKLWVPDIPIVIGGPYATVDYNFILNDKNIDLAILAEGELTMHNLLEEIIENNKKLPSEDVLKTIQGIAFVPKEEKDKNKAAREIIALDLIEDELSKKPKNDLSLVNDSNNLAYVIYTSGSTGAPKGVMIEHKNVLNTIDWFIEKYGINCKTNTAQVSEYSFDPSIEQVFSSLLTGGKLFLVNTQMLLETKKFRKMLIENSINVVNAVPSVLKENFFDNKKIPGIKAIIAGGEKLDKTVKDQILLNGYDLYNHYGTTEVTIDAITSKCEFDSVAIGKPISNTKCYILDDNLKMVPIGVIGNICIAGHGLARGYVNDPELTAKKFIKLKEMGNILVYNTGDKGRWLPDGSIEYLGRIDNQVKVRGFRIELEEIEEKMKLVPGVTEAVVVLCGDDEENNFIRAYYSSEDVIENKYIQKQLSLDLPPYMIPSEFIRLEKFPKLSSGKIDKKVLPMSVSTETNVNVKMPENELQAEILNIWVDVLKKDKNTIGIDANFFEIGGHSLKATILLSKLAKRFGVTISLSQMFERPTIENIAEIINELKNVEEDGMRAFEKRAYYPLSSAQKRLYFLDQFENIGSSYNMTEVLKIKGDLNLELCEKVFKQIIERHEILRTSFELVDNNTVQVVHESVDFKLDILPELSEEDLDKIKDCIHGFIKPYDLGNLPLFKVGVIPLKNKEHILIFDIHHIIADGTSISILINEFVKLYSGEELLPLKIQYKDYSLWQNNELQSKKLKKQDEFWLNQFSGDIPRLDMPTDYKRPKVFSYKGDLLQFKFNANDTKELIKLSKDKNVTLYMALMAVLNVVLHKYTGQRDIIVGSGIANRNNADFQSLIGMFVNSIALRNSPMPEKSFSEFLNEVKENSIAAFENQDFQFEDLIDKLNLQRDISRNPIFDVSLNIQNFEQSSFKINDLEIEPYNLRQNTSKFDLTIYISQVEKELHFSLEYYTEIFKKETMERFIKHFTNAIRVVSENPQINIGEINIFDHEERDIVSNIFNQTEKNYDKQSTLYEKFERIVDLYPDKTALYFKGNSLTYKELDGKANKVANYLIEKYKIKPEQRIGLCLEKSFDYIVAILGILKAGAAYVPIDTSLSLKRMKTIIEDADIDIMISHKQFLRVMNNLQWSSSIFNTCIYMDYNDICEIDELDDEYYKKQVELWNYVGKQSKDDVTGGGWISSFTGKPFSEEEMKEYSLNVLRKLEGFINNNTRVLEIGVGSGLTMFEVVGKTQRYVGIDISDEIIEKNRIRAKNEGIENIRLERMAAHDIDRLGERDFDLIILNSVVQSFPGHNYFGKVINKASSLLKSNGVIFVGDVMDSDLKDKMIEDLTKFNAENQDENYIAKLDWSSELFIPKKFFIDIKLKSSIITRIEFSGKIYTIENELTKYRYDALIRVDKTSSKDREKKKAEKIQVGYNEIAKFSEERPNVKVKMENLAYIIFTSGTEGKPKGVMVEHGNVVNTIEFFIEKYDLRSFKNVLQLTSYTFDPSVEQIFSTILSGSTLCVPDKELSLDIQGLREYIEENKINIINSVPIFLKELLVGKPKLPSLQYAITGGEKLDEITKSQILDLGYNLYNHYGPTETTIDAITGKCSDEDYSIGKPIANMRCYILDDSLKLLPIGVNGELYLAGDGVTRGYLKDAKLTDEKFVEIDELGEKRAYKTGDVARWMSNGRIELAGRKDFQIKLRGYRIELGEIEFYLKKYPGIIDAVVIDGESTKKEKYICAYYTSNTKIEAAEFREYLLDYLPEYMIPKFIVYLNKIPLKSNNKVDYKLLPDPTMEVSNSDIEEEECSETESKLKSIWCDLLEVESMGIHDNFFESGGHSIKAITLSMMIRKEFGIDISITQIFKHQIIKEQAQLIDEIRNKSTEITIENNYCRIETIEKREYYEASSSQKRMYIIQDFDKENVAY
ncbi:D-alanine--poly(phosphoribitol) ligase subunit DltA, partial [Clostridium frigidicarnis]